jgi:phosphoglycolate phosphatase
MVGDGARVLVARALAAGDGGPANESEVSRVHARFLDEYALDPVPATREMPGAFALLAALRAREIPAIVCTNKARRIASLVVARVLGERVQGLVAGGDTAKLKPDAGPILAALALVGAAANRSVMIGDGTQDVRAARAAGVACIGFHGGYGDGTRLLETPPDASVDHFDQVRVMLGL